MQAKKVIMHLYVKNNAFYIAFFRYTFLMF